MRNFVILFTEKEGSTPLVRLLDNFNQISIVHQQDTVAWEPFDVNGCGPMTLDDLAGCLNMVFSPGKTDIKQLNDIYCKTSTKPLATFDDSCSVGFKMRYVTPSSPFQFKTDSMLQKVSKKVFQSLGAKAYHQKMLEVFKDNNVMVFFCVRQDLLRWGISKYHGDGTGKAGHLQFKLANGKISEKDIGKLEIDCNRLDKIIKQCEKIHQNRQQLMQQFQAAGIDTYPLCYEDFLTDKPNYLKGLFEQLDLQVSDEQIDDVLSQKQYFKKVHSDNIADIVVNHQEVTDRFSESFFPWR